MTEASACILASAVLVNGRWIDALDALDAAAREPVAEAAPVRLEPALATARLERADRATQLAARVTGRAMATVPRDPSASTSVLTASVLASAFTNERFELRRLEGRAPEARSFAYTAPNAAAGELAIALGARGPTLALVGSSEVALAALERAAQWLARGRCDRVVLVAFECPPAVAPDRVAPRGLARAPLECAAAVVLARASRSPDARGVSVRWLDPPEPATHAEPSPLLSVHALAAVALGAPRVLAAAASGAVLCARAT